MKNSKKGVLVGKYSMITGGLVLGTVLVSGALSGSVVSAEGDSAVDDVTITVPTACTMSGVVDTAHTTSMQAATYSGTSGIGKTTLTTHCNDNNGFSIYAVGFTNDTDGTNTLVGTTSSQTINTGIYTSGATDSSWSMKVSKVTDSSESYNPQNVTITNSFDNWHLVPTSYTKVAEYHAATGSSTTDTVLGAKVETTYDAYISRTQTADTYTGKVKYVMVHPYDASAPEKVVKDISNSTTMQEVEACPSTLTTGQVYTIKDSRDNQDYKVARLADGKCWMVENLNIAGGTPLSSENTDVTSTYISNFSTSNNLTKSSDTIILPASSTSGFDVANNSYVYNSNNKTNCGASGQNTSCYSYYSWDVATLGSGRSISTDNTDAEQSICPKGWRLPMSGAYSDDGWKRGDFYALATAYGVDLESNFYESSATFYNNAGPSTTSDFVFAGIYDYGSFSLGAYGYYWSSTSYSSTDTARNFAFGNDFVNSASTYNRAAGFSIRCLLRI